MNYALLESEIVDRLNPITASGFSVQIMPETTAEYTKPPAGAGSVIVAYKGSDFDMADRVPALKSVDGVVQEERATIEVVLRARLLRGTGGIHDMKSQVQARLLGFRTTDWGDLVLKAFNYVTFEEGIWVYAFTYECAALAVLLPDEPDEVLITQINVDTVNVAT